LLSAKFGKHWFQLLWDIGIFLSKTYVLQEKNQFREIDTRSENLGEVFDGVLLAVGVKILIEMESGQFVVKRTPNGRFTWKFDSIRGSVEKWELGMRPPGSPFVWPVHCLDGTTQEIFKLTNVAFLRVAIAVLRTLGWSANIIETVNGT
jgi:hypothetical protein